jgi:diguanylate cyclase (GGDEF)-like protein
VPFTGNYDGSIVAVLEQLRLTAGLEGLSVVDLSPDAQDAPIAYSVGSGGDSTVAFALSMLHASPGEPCHKVAPDKRPVLTCPWVLPPNRPGGLVMWRLPRARPWAGSDRDWAASVGLLLRAAIGNGMGQVGIDRLTGLPNRRWFLDEADRHIDRLDLDCGVGTLVLIDIDDLRGLNMVAGRAEGDRVLVRMSGQLRAMVRPGDLVARIGADEFGLWLNSMDHLTAAERAEALCQKRPFREQPEGYRTTFSIGIATRQPGSAEDVRTLLRRAHMAARDVKAKGGGGWRVAHAEATGP